MASRLQAMALNARRQSKMLIPGPIRRASVQVFHLLAFLVVYFPPLTHYRKRLLATWPLPDRRNGLDRRLFHHVCGLWFNSIYLREKNPDKRDNLKSALMGADAGLRWAKLYDSRPLDFSESIGDLNFLEAQPFYSFVDQACKKCSPKTLLVQIGCSSGRELAWLAARYPNIMFIGVDIYPEVVGYAQSAHGSSNLSFTGGAAHTISQAIPAGFDNHIFFSSGCLEYVQPEHVFEFFRQLYDFRKCQCIIGEPCHSWDTEPDRIGGSFWSGNLAYTHDYRFYATQAGFEAISSVITHPYASGKHENPESKVVYNLHASNYLAHRCTTEST